MAQLIRPPTSDHNPTVQQLRVSFETEPDALTWGTPLFGSSEFGNLDAVLERSCLQGRTFPFHLTSEVCVSIWLMSLKTEPLKKPSNTQVTLLAISYCDVTDEECLVQWLSCFVSGIEFAVLKCHQSIYTAMINLYQTERGQFNYCLIDTSWIWYKWSMNRECVCVFQRSSWRPPDGT